MLVFHGEICQNRNVLVRLAVCVPHAIDVVSFEASATCVNAVSAEWLDDGEGLYERQNETGSWFPTRLTVTLSRSLALFSILTNYS